MTHVVDHNDDKFQFAKMMAEQMYDKCLSFQYIPHTNVVNIFDHDNPLHWIFDVEDNYVKILDTEAMFEFKDYIFHFTKIDDEVYRYDGCKWKWSIFEKGNIS